MSGRMVYPKAERFSGQVTAVRGRSADDPESPVHRRGPGGEEGCQLFPSLSFTYSPTMIAAG
jgi:hypothetical protein